MSEFPGQFGVLWNELVLIAVAPLPFCPQLPGNDPNMEAFCTVHVLRSELREKLIFI